MDLSEEDVQKLRSKLQARGRPGNPGPKLTQEQRQQLIRDYLADPELSFRELAAKYGVRPQTVWYHVTRAAR